MRRFLGNMTWQIFSQGVSKIIYLIVFLFLAKRLGASEFGRFSLALGLAYGLAVLMDFGCDPLITRETAQGKPQIFWNALRLKAVMGVAALLTGGILSLILQKKVGNVLWLLSAGLFLQSFTNAFNATLRGLGRMAMEASVNLWQKAALAGLIFLGVALSPTAERASLAFFLSHILSCAYVLGLIRFSSLAKIPIRAEPLANLFRIALPLVLAGISWMVYFRLDAILLGLIKSERDLGLYSAAYRLMEGIFLVPGAILLALFPRLSSAASERQKFSEIFRRSFLALSGLGLAAALVGFFSGPALIGRILGEEYKAAGSILQGLIWVCIFVFPGHLVTQSLVALGRERLSSFLSFLSALFGLVAYLILIPPFGIGGAVAGTLITECFVTLLFWRSVIQELKR